MNGIACSKIYAFEKINWIAH
jgi:hypothetical protein